MVEQDRNARGVSQRYFDGGDESSVASAEIANWLTRTHQRARASEALPSLSSWMRQMEHYPQLLPEAQGELAAAYQEGLAAEEKLSAGGKIGVREERRLREVAYRGKQAIEYLSASNFRLVVLISREKAEARYGRERAAEMLPDLVGYANIAIIEAARAYNPNAGPSFPTYAASKIRHAVLMMLNRDHPIKVPPSWTRLKRIVAVRVPVLTAELGRTPSREELMVELHKTCMAWAYDKLTPAEKKLPKKEREQCQIDRLRKQGMLGALENLDEVLVQTQAVSYLDAPSRDDGSSLGDLLAAEEHDMTAGMVAEEMKEAVSKVLADLPDRDREIISYRYGFIDGEQWSYQKISVLYNVSAERIRQIEKAAISKLRLPGLGDHLGGFLGHQIED
jgi:RNA polymerase sigma factor (sigma-70 family)